MLPPATRNPGPSSPAKAAGERAEEKSGMIHPNVGFKDAILEALPGGRFRLTDAGTSRPVSAIEFQNRKAARNWAHGKGMRVLERETPRTAAFPAPLG